MQEYDGNVVNEEEKQEESQEECQEELSEISSKSRYEFLFRDIDGELYNATNGAEGKNMLEANVYETPTHYVVECLAAGLGKEDINVTYMNDVLTVSIQKDKYKFGRNKDNNEFENYERRFLVREVDFKKIKGVLKNGILTIRVPKKPFDGEPRKIRIS